MDYYYYAAIWYGIGTGKSGFQRGRFHDLLTRIYSKYIILLFCVQKNSEKNPIVHK